MACVCLGISIQHPIQSIYPEQNLRIRPVINKVVVPREAQQPPLVHRPFSIMWTRVGKLPSKEPLWSPNHFVACIPTVHQGHPNLSHATLPGPSLPALPEPVTGTMHIKSRLYSSVVRGSRSTFPCSSNASRSAATPRSSPPHVSSYKKIPASPKKGHTHQQAFHHRAYCP